MLGETCDFVGVAIACSEVKVAELSNEDAGDLTAVVLEPARVSVSVNCTPLAVSKGEDELIVWLVFEICAGVGEVVLEGSNEITVVCAPVTMTLVGLRAEAETLESPVLEIWFDVVLVVPVCDSVPVCEVVLAVGSTTGTIDRTSSVLVAPPP